MELCEEIQMLLEVADKVAEARVYAAQRGEELSSWEKGETSGKATEDVIRDQLLKKGFNMSKTRVQIYPLKKEIDLLLLKPRIDPTKLTYSPDEVDTILEIKNNAVTDQTKRTRKNFDQLKAIAKNVRFAFVVLSERITYLHRVTSERLGYPVFELISRRRSAGRWMESRSEILVEYKRTTRNDERSMWETGQWSKLIDYLSSKNEK